MNTDLVQTVTFLLAHLGTNQPPDIAVTQSVPWSSYATAFNALLLGGGFALRHVIGWWLNAGGWNGFIAKFKNGNTPPAEPGKGI